MKRLLILLPLLALAGCAPYDRTAAQPAGGELPLDRNGGGIDVVSGTKQAPVFTDDTRPAVGQVHAQ